jgi:hypothetical protein
MTPEFKGPIPGANLLADTRKYPWHRPPEIVEYDEAVDYMLTKMSEDEQSELIYSLLQIDINVPTVVSSLLLQAVSRGKLPIDLAVLIAGPMARYIEIIAKMEGYKYDMGLDESDRLRVTPELLKRSLGIIDKEDPEDIMVDAEAQPSPDIPMGGIMGGAEVPEQGVAPEDEQAAMLGLTVEEEETDGLA